MFNCHSVCGSQFSTNQELQMSTPKTKTATKAPAKIAKAAKPETKITAATKLVFVTPRPNNKQGPKTQILLAVPKKGSIAFKTLSEKMAAAGMKAPTILKFVTRLARDGHIGVQN
jgi:hypothetical protein